MAKVTVSSVPQKAEGYTGPVPDTWSLIIFGASGDLTKRKLVPALFHLEQAGLLPDHWYVIGLGRSEMDDETFRRIVLESLDGLLKAGSTQTSDCKKFAERFHYLAGDSQNLQYYSVLSSRLNQLDQEHGTLGNRLFYLATPPNLYPGIVHQLGSAGLNRSVRENGWNRIIIEKPFGSDLASAQALNKNIGQVFTEKQIYRIDHYLGKETVQNILFFRFANAIFEPIWNRQYIDHIQITVAEDIGIEHRAGYYEGAGVLRDMFQNHLLQLLCLVGMEPPVSFDADAVRGEKVKVIKAIRPIPPEQMDRFAVRGQYGPGVVNGRQVNGYRGEPKVIADSKTETFAALKLQIDNWRWKGVRFYLRSGKRLPKRTAEIAIEFKWVPHLLFGSLAAEGIKPNTLVFRIQPDEGIN